MYINEMFPGSDVIIKASVDGTELEFNTSILEIDQTHYKKYGYSILCKAVYVDDKLVSFGHCAVIAIVKNKYDNRHYLFPISGAKLERRGRMPVIRFCSDESVKPTNYRNAFRVPCKYRAIMQLRGNRKECVTHDLSYTGGAYLFAKGSVSFEENDHVSVTILCNDNTKYVVKGTIVRIVSDFEDRFVLIGMQFDGDVDIRKLIMDLQMESLRRASGKL